MMLADEARAIVGSINFSPGSFDSRRELAIEVDDHHVVKQPHHVVHHDWKHAHPLDLSDEGLFEDLEKRGGEGAEKLALNVGKKKREKGTPKKERKSTKPLLGRVPWGRGAGEPHPVLDGVVRLRVHLDHRHRRVDGVVERRPLDALEPGRPSQVAR